MNTPSKLRSLLAKLLIITMTSTLLPAQTRAEMVSTERAVGGDRERILLLLDRPDVAAQLEAYGVKASDAKARLAALSEAELGQLSAEVDKAHAGAGGGGGLAAVATIVVVVFLLPFVIIGALVIAGLRSGSAKQSTKSHQP